MPKKNNLAEDDEHNDSASTSSNIQSKRRHSTTDQRTMLSKRVEKKQSKDDSKNSAARVGELKGLQDSLTKFFTPNEVRRSRSTFKASLDQPLEISIDAKFPMGAQSTDSFQSSKTGTSSHISPKSPHRRDKLEDSLSQYFTPNPNNKRRLHKEGEYWQLSRGDAQSNNGMSPDGSEHQNDNFADIKHENDDDERKDEKSRALSRQSRTQKSNQKSEGRKKSATASAADAKQSMKRVCVLAPRKENAAAIKLLKRAYKGARDTRRQMPVSSSLKAPNAPTSLKNSITNYFRPVKPLASSSTALEINIPQAGISEEDRALFEKARQAALKDLEAANNTLKQNPNAIFPPKIRIHCYEIDTWYSAPFPQEYACLPLLHICDACLMYLSVPSSHMRKCRQQFPPGNEIYRGSNFSIFEVDGNQARVYCRNLCLLAKLFIDHKTLYFDVEPFLFYVLTLNDETGCHFVGYFSKEKYSSQKFNLACIVTLPCYQGQGFGRFLIDFSYLLSRKEGLAGSPERPLSDLGRIAYQSYWLSAILEYFHGRLQQQQGKAAMRQLTLKEISILTGIAAHDIAETLAENLMLFTKNSKTEIVLDEAQILAHWEKAKRNKRRIWLDESKLQWTPKIYSPSKEFRLRSPTFTPLPSISSPNRLGAEMEKMEIGTNDEKQSSASAQKKGKSGSARRKVEMSPKTPKVSTGKIGRKKAPGKSAHESQSSSFEEEDEERKVPVKSTEKKAAEKQKKTKRTSCKETTEKRQKKRGTSSTDDEEKDQAEPRLAKQLSRSLTIATAQPSTSTARSLQKTSSHKCTISSSGHKHTARTNSMAASESGTEGEEEEKKEATTKSTTGGQKHIKVAEPPVKKGQKIFVKDADPESDNSSAASSIGARKKRRILKKRRAPAPKKRSAGSSSTAGDSSEEDNESVAATREGHGTTESKRQRKSIQQQHIDDESSDEDEEEEEEEETEDHSCCSSASPQPIGDRLPIFKPPSLKEHDNMVNMGGEPDTVNMGGEPDDEDMDTTNNNSSETTAAVNSSAVGGISSYKTPVLVVAPHPMAEEESAELEVEEEENPSPMIGPQMKLLEQQQQQQTLLAQLSVNEQFSSEKGERQQQGNLTLSQSQPSFSQPPQTLKIPTIQADAHKSCSPSADVATVEMPALDAAERHISPSESHSRFGEEEPVEDDAPPMLSPQDGNSTGNETAAATATTMMVPIMPIPVRASAACENLLKTTTTIAAESSHNQTMLGEENTSSSSADPLIGLLSAERRLSNERSRENASQPLPAAQVETPRLSASAQPHQPSEFQQNPVQQQQQNNISRTTIPFPVRASAATEELLNNNTSALPQIRVRSESNVEFCTQLPSANKMQRTSSFSGGAAAMAVAAAVVNKEPTLLQPMQPTLSTLSIPSNNAHAIPNVPRPAEVVHPFVHQQQQQQQAHYAAMMQQQQHALSSFMAPAYSQQAYANAVAAQHQQQTQLPPQPQMPQQLPQQQQQPSKSKAKEKEKPAAAEKSKKSNKEKAKTATAKTSGTEKNKSPQKQLQPASQSAAIVPTAAAAIVPSMPSTSAASAAALQSHWAQFAQQYYQQQQQHNPYAYQMAAVANRPGAAATAQQHQQQQNAAAAAEFAAAQQHMGPYASSYNQLYNQAAAWQAWQMSAAAKFPAGQAAAAAGGYPYPAAAEFFNFNMANGGGVPSGSAAAAGLMPMAGPSAHPPAVWPAEFNHLRHPASAQSQAGFYTHPHPPM